MAVRALCLQRHVDPLLVGPPLEDGRREAARDAARQPPGLEQLLLAHVLVPVVGVVGGVLQQVLVQEPGKMPGGLGMLGDERYFAQQH